MRAIFMTHRTKKPKKEKRIVNATANNSEMVAAKAYSKGKITPEMRTMLSQVFQGNNQ